MHCKNNKYPSGVVLSVAEVGFRGKVFMGQIYFNSIASFNLSKMAVFS